MRNRWKKTTAFLLAAVMLGSGAIDCAQAAAPKPKLSQKKLTLSVSDAKKLTVAGGKGCRVSWKSSRGKIVSVNKKGKVVAKRAGTAKITATVKNKKTEKKSVLVCRVTVKEKSEDTASQSPSAVPTTAPIPSAVAQTNPPAPSEAAVTPLPTASEAAATSLPFEMDEPSSAATAGSIGFRGKHFEYSDPPDSDKRKPQGHAVYNMQELADLKQKLLSPNGYRINEDIEPFLSQYQEAFFQDKMLYCYLFPTGSSLYEFHVTDVWFVKNDAGKEVLTVLLEDKREDMMHLTVPELHVAFLELDQKDFERAEEIKFIIRSRR